MTVIGLRCFEISFIVIWGCPTNLKLHGIIPIKVLEYKLTSESRTVSITTTIRFDCVACLLNTHYFIASLVYIHVNRCYVTVDKIVFLQASMLKELIKIKQRQKDEQKKFKNYS